MTKIVVFDSGFGSLSVIQQIQKITKAEIIYFADQKNFPYGNKTKHQLSKIINQTIHLIKSKFNPDVIVIASNTPTLRLENITSPKIFGVLPPIKEALRLSKKNNIAILTTFSVSKSKELQNYLKKHHIPKKIKIKKINASPLIDLVESGKFLTEKKNCSLFIKKFLQGKFLKNNIDVVTLSSTHLPFLRSYLEKEFPNIIFLDPAYELSKKIAKITGKGLQRNTLKIFTSGDPKIFQKRLRKIGIKNKVNFLP